MFSRLENVEQRYLELEAQLGTPDVISDPERYTAVLKEYKSLEPLATCIARRSKVRDELDSAKEIFYDTADADLRKMAQEEIQKCQETLNSIEKEIKILLIPKDPLDEKNVIIEIRACAGGEEAALFAAVLYRMYSMFALTHNFALSLLNENPTELGGYREITFMISGQGAYSKFKYESGVHRVQRVPLTESQGRIQTSTVTVAVLPEAQPVEVNVNPADIIFDTCKSSGAGGQHINKTESAVRLTHKPTGIVVECQEERSQYKNRDKAMIMLCTKLLQMKREEQDRQISSERRSQVGTGDRSEKIRTYNYPQNRLTDHRINLTLYCLEDVLNGKIDPIIEALLADEQTKKLAGDTQ